jgi:hypothetical protein
MFYANAREMGWKPVDRLAACGEFPCDIFAFSAGKNSRC